jgi:hypothetical protein
LTRGSDVLISKPAETGFKMTRIGKFYLAVFAAQFLLISVATFSFAQIDPTKALIGRWEGQIEISGNNGRTLMINSVKAKGEGEWVARGRYAITGPESNKTTGGSEMSVLSKDNEIYVEFIVGSTKNPVKLKLVSENKLEGTINVVVRGRGEDRRIGFEKVETKAGETK